MEYIEANPLPEVCLACTEPDCDVCDHGRERWLLSTEDETALKLKLFQQGLKRKSTAYLLAQLRREMDAARDRYLKSLGIRVLRYTNADVRQRFQEVCQDIWNYVMEVTE